MMDRINEWFDKASLTQRFAGIASGAALIFLAFFLLRSAGNSSGGTGSMQDSVKMICQNPACRNEFKVSPAEVRTYMAKHEGAAYPCPKCGGTDLRQEGERSRDRPSAPARAR